VITKRPFSPLRSLASPAARRPPRMRCSAAGVAGRIAWPSADRDAARARDRGPRSSSAGVRGRATASADDLPVVTAVATCCARWRMPAPSAAATSVESLQGSQFAWRGAIDRTARASRSCAARRRARGGRSRDAWAAACPAAAPRWIRASARRSGRPRSSSTASSPCGSSPGPAIATAPLPTNVELAFAVAARVAQQARRRELLIETIDGMPPRVAFARGLLAAGAADRLCAARRACVPPG